MSQSTRNRRSLFVILALLIATLAGHVLSRQPTPTNAVLPTLAPTTTTALAVVDDGRIRLSGHFDRNAVLEGGDGLVRMELTLAAADPSEMACCRLDIAHAPSDVVVVLDRSGSMDGDKLQHAKAAILELIGQLEASDRFALVAYADGAELLSSLIPAQPDARSSWRNRVAALAAGGGTNMSSGLDLAQEILGQRRERRGMSRIILISDGLANQGDSSPEGLQQRASRFAHLEMSLSTIGVGAGFNEFLMSALADAGTGNFYYLEDTERLAEVFANELDATRTTVARTVTVELAPALGIELADAAGYPLERRPDGTIQFQPGALFAGQKRQIWLTFKVPNQLQGSFPIGRLRATYSTGEAQAALAWQDLPEIACVADEERFLAAIDKDTWSRSVSEETYNQLQQQVAQYVRQGRRDEALQEITSYRDHYSQLNQSLQDENVANTLRQTDTLTSEVEGAFEGDHQALKQNLLSKEKLSSALDGRRQGSKKVSPPKNR